MSQDLFEAFGVPQGSIVGALDTPSETNKSPFLKDFSAQNHLGQITNTVGGGHSGAIIEDDDDWGEFEGAVGVSDVAHQSQDTVAAAPSSRAATRSGPSGSDARSAMAGRIGPN